MKFLFVWLLPTVLLTSALSAEEGAPVPTSWPGVKVQVSNIKRLDDHRVLMVIRLRSDGTGAEPITIGEIPREPKPKPSKPGRQRLEEPEVLPKPYSLVSARLVDEATRQEYAALPSLPRKPYFGPNAMVTTLGPGGWIQMAVCFNAPPPLPPGANGKRPLQKVSVLLPRAAKPISGLLLPAAGEEGVAAAKP